MLGKEQTEFENLKHLPLIWREIESKNHDAQTILRLNVYCASASCVSWWTGALYGIALFLKPPGYPTAGHIMFVFTLFYSLEWKYPERGAPEWRIAHVCNIIIVLKVHCAPLKSLIFYMYLQIYVASCTQWSALWPIGDIFYSIDQWQHALVKFLHSPRRRNFSLKFMA